MTDETNELFAICKLKQNIYIYGAGKNAHDIYYFFKMRNIRITGFLVSNMQGNPHILFDHPVMEIDAFSDNSEYLILVPIFKNTAAYREICDCLVNKQIHNVYFLSSGLLHHIKEEALAQRKRELFYFAWGFHKPGE